MLDSLLSAPVLAFALAVAAGLARFEARLPEALPPVLATFLLFAIGLKGGRSLSEVAPTELAGPLHDLEDLHIELDVDASDAVTVAGLVSELLGRLPAVGDEVEVSGHRLRVEAADARTVRQVMISRRADGGGVQP